jgi:hypothetical protein
MAKTVTVNLGDETYVVPRLDIGQIEDIAEHWDMLRAANVGAANTNVTGKQAIAQIRMLAEITLRRATPTISDFRALECNPDELRLANDAILRTSGLIKETAEVGEAETARVA